VLDSLRQPLETGDVVIARANAHVRFPAAFQLVCALNPCKCGYGKASGRNCGRGPNCEVMYQSRVSGPFMDRMDLAIETPPVSALDLAAPATGEPTATVAARVATAREAQSTRARELAQQAGMSDTPSNAMPLTNARLSDKFLEKVAAPDAEGAALLSRAAESLSLSARAYTRTLRVARTLADLEGTTAVARRHIAEAISYRRRDDASLPAHQSAMVSG
jgi:magnesium chelatase family protein